jgi:anti-sigma factor RsiW
MSRDRKRSGAEADAEVDAEAHARSPGAPELLAAYVDGVAELPVDERRAIEGWLDGNAAGRAEAAEVHGLIDRLRALPASDAGGEPDWAAMARSIRQAVADVPIRPWWRRWQWLIPAMTCATAAAVLVVMWPRTPAVPVNAPERTPITAPAPTVPRAAAPNATGEDGFALWLDGRVVDVDPAAMPSAVDDVLGDLEAPVAGEALDDDGLLPASDLAWLDGLDEAELARAERWLAEPDSGGGGAGASAHGHYRKKS